MMPCAASGLIPTESALYSDCWCSPTMRRAWLILLLILVISTQLALLSAFHDVEVDGFASGNTVIAVAKWDYVQGSVRISVTPQLLPNGTTQAEVVFPNGTSVHISYPTPGQSYTFVYQLPKTGDCFCSGYTSGPMSLSPSQPLNVTISQNVSDVPGDLNFLNAVTSSIQPAIDTYAFVVYGEAQVYVSGYVLAI